MNPFLSKRWCPDDLCAALEEEARGPYFPSSLSPSGQKIRLRACPAMTAPTCQLGEQETHGTAEPSPLPPMISMQNLPPYNLGVLVIGQNKGFPKVREPEALLIPPFPSPQQ